jgi:hypothetical protein
MAAFITAMAVTPLACGARDSPSLGRRFRRSLTGIKAERAM